MTVSLHGPWHGALHPLCAKIHLHMSKNSDGYPLPQDKDFKAYEPPVITIALSRMVSCNNRHQSNRFLSGCIHQDVLLIVKVVVQ